MNPASFEKYLNAFGKLKRAHSPGHGQAPHKPILLLAIMDEINEGRIQDNFIELTPELIAAFQNFWKALVTDDHWQPRIEYPFRHLYKEGFWNFLQYGHIVEPERITYSLHQLRGTFDGVCLATDLWVLLQNRECRATLYQHLLSVYFYTDAVQRDNVEDFLNAQIQQLMDEAHSEFRVRKVRESTDNGYYVRHALFPRVIKRLYDHSCAVCGVSARVGARSSIIEAAHVLPFSEFHNDHLRNGIAMCKNHHWGFDAGAFVIGDNFEVILCPSLIVSGEYINDKVLVNLPIDSAYRPHIEGIRWHREKWQKIWRGVIPAR